MWQDIGSQHADDAIDTFEPSERTGEEDWPPKSIRFR
jgi:hypothetical protein